VSFDGIAPGPQGTEHLGCCSQVAVFKRISSSVSPEKLLRTCQPYNLVFHIFICLEFYIVTAWLYLLQFNYHYGVLSDFLICVWYDTKFLTALCSSTLLTEDSFCHGFWPLQGDIQH